MIRIGSLAFMLCLFASLGFSWTAATAPASCLTTYSVAGANFTFQENANNYTNLPGGFSCSASTQAFYGTYDLAQPLGGIALKYNNNVTGNITITRIGAPGSTAVALALPTPTQSRNYSFSANALTKANQTAYSALCAGITGGKIIYYNTTHWNATTSGTCSALLSASTERIAFEGDASVIIRYEYWDVPAATAQEFYWNSTYPPALENANLYLSTFGGKTLRGDFRNKTETIATPGTYCRALLYFNNPYYGNIQLIPKITYNPGVEAFPNFYNQSDNSAFLPNNTITYIYDQVTSAWYIVPATICPNFINPLTVATLQYNPTGIQTGTTGQIPIEQRSLNGSCSINDATRVVTCTASDSSNTLQTINLTGYKIANSSVVCANGTAGSSATLGCTLPNINATYTIYVYGADANGFYHYITAENFNVGVLPGVSSYGRDGYLAAMVLVLMIGLVATQSLPIAMLLGVAGMLMVALMGIVPVGPTVTIAIAFGAIALMLAYRLRV